MKHTPVINLNRATCQCGNMQGIWRRADEPVGAFTLRAYADYERHVASTPADVRGTLFDFERSKPVVQETADLFG